MFHFPRLLLCIYIFNAQYLGIPLDGFPHSDTLGSTVVCHLPEVFRRLLRPSSAITVEPSTVYPYNALHSLSTHDLLVMISVRLLFLRRIFSCKRSEGRAGLSSKKLF